MKIILTIWYRLILNSSQFFNWLGGICVALAGMGVTLDAAHIDYAVWKGQTLHSLLIIVGAAGGAICRLTVKNPAQLNALVNKSV